MSSNELTVEDKREIALERADELKSRIEDYLEASKTIPTGFKNDQRIQQMKQKLLEHFSATEDDWKDWKWQMKNRITDAKTLSKFIKLSDQEFEEIEKVGKEYRWAVSPYYLTTIDPEDPDCPVKKMTIPCIHEMGDVVGKADPMGEEFTSPAPSITRRYPDRLIINVTNQCAMYCRHCQRRRNIGETDVMTPKEKLEEALEYVRQNPEIRDVLLTGGDALMLSDANLDWILTELDNIPHVEIKRLGTRTLVTVPQRITPELCEILEKHHPVYLNTQFNHPAEITKEVLEATDKLTKAGLQLGNQAVLLNGVNNNAHVMKKLNHELLKVRIRPYYIFHAKAVIGTKHFWTTVEEGLEIMENLRGYTSGLAIPTYIINAPSGNGKTPMLPEYMISQGDEYVTIRTWENKVFKYDNKKGI
ncbi:lysine 2,3-aminomutase [Desulfitispora alkaliphila]|uniref:glutamate 2,3-aminomutase n=1 Tax=Desulfitispora alkaliphila TaxID=622674 RepID=UPI003D1B9064